MTKTHFDPFIDYGALGTFSSLFLLYTFFFHESIRRITQLGFEGQLCVFCFCDGHIFGCFFAKCYIIVLFFQPFCIYVLMVGKVVRYSAKHAIWNLLTGADAEQTSSSGRRAIDFAKENDRDGSHQEVIELLEAFCFKKKKTHVV